MPDFLRTDAVAALLDVSPQTVAIWRCKKIGPAFLVLNGAIRYSREAIEEYIRTHTVVPGGVTPEGIKRRPGGSGRPRGLGRQPQKRRKVGAR